MTDFGSDVGDGGFILVDKPLGWTSFDVVGKLRGALGAHYGKRVKVGHAGTLDPLATGLLILGYGPFTRKLQDLSGEEKTYEGEMTLGATTPSYDLETEVSDQRPFAHITAADIERAMTEFRGAIMQRPPLYSAKRHKGERAYHLARGGSTVEMDAVPVIVLDLELREMTLPKVGFMARVSKGTYIRSLVHDLGASLGCGAHLSGLRRTRIAQYDVADARTPEEWSAVLGRP